MKMIAGYLENARKFERLATKESDPKLKAHFEQEARWPIVNLPPSGRKSLACHRPMELGLVGKRPS
jgi:hypothetical protein